MKLQFAFLKRLPTLYEYRDDPEAMRHLADIAWRGILLVVACIAVCGIVFALIQLQSALAPSSSSVQIKTRDPLDPKQLHAVLDAFAARKGEYESLQQSGYQISDPH